MRRFAIVLVVAILAYTIVIQDERGNPASFGSSYRIPPPTTYRFVLPPANPVSAHFGGGMLFHPHTRPGKAKFRVLTTGKIFVASVVMTGNFEFRQLDRVELNVEESTSFELSFLGAQRERIVVGNLTNRELNVVIMQVL